jgi:hypothetical protein
VSCPPFESPEEEVQVFLLKPSLSLYFAPLPLEAFRRAFATQRVDPAALTWRPATSRTVGHETVDLALRHGVACSIGLVLDDADVDAVTDVAVLRDTLDSVAENPVLARSLAHYEDLLSGDPDPELAEHWDAIGGRRIA